MKETEAQHRSRILAAKAVRTFIIQNPGCNDLEIVRATGFQAFKVMRGGAGLLVRAEMGKDRVRRWWPKSANESADEQISRAVAAIERKHGFVQIETSTPLSQLIEGDTDATCRDEKGDELTVIEVKRDAWAGVLRWLFEKGADPRIVMRRLYALAHEVGPQLLRDLTHEEIALLLGDGAGRATSSARSQAIFGGLKSALGIVTEFGTGHKSAGARDKMRASAMGNKNRKGGKLAAVERMPVDLTQTKGVNAA